jgi:hypothetical protein
VSMLPRLPSSGARRLRSSTKGSLRYSSCRVCGLRRRTRGYGNITKFIDYISFGPRLAYPLSLLTSTSRTARCGPAFRGVWKGGERNSPLYCFTRSPEQQIQIGSHDTMPRRRTQQIVSIKYHPLVGYKGGHPAFATFQCDITA